MCTQNLVNANFTFAISVAQAIVAKSFTMVGKDMTGNGSNYHQVIGAGTNTSAQQSTWSGSHVPPSCYSTSKDTSQTTVSWSYGSGNINRPLSRKCKFYIKY